MATKPEIERLTRVEEKQTVMAKQLDEVQRDVKAMRETLDNLNGGKKAVIWLIGALTAVGVLVVGILNLTRHK